MKANMCMNNHDETQPRGPSWSADHIQVFIFSTLTSFVPSYYMAYGCYIVLLNISLYYKWSSAEMSLTPSFFFSSRNNFFSKKVNFIQAPSRGYKLNPNAYTTNPARRPIPARRHHTCPKAPYGPKASRSRSCTALAPHLHHICAPRGSHHTAPTASRSHMHRTHLHRTEFHRKELKCHPRGSNPQLQGDMPPS